MASAATESIVETRTDTEPNPQTMTEAETTAQAGNTTEPVKNPVAVDPSETAKVAYQLWLDRGCPHGSDQEDWFRAEEILKTTR